MTKTQLLQLHTIWYLFGFPFVYTDYVPCSDVEELTIQVSTPSVDENSNSPNCFHKMIFLDRSTTGLQSFRIGKNGLYIFNLLVTTHGEAITSSLMVNGVEVLQMSTQVKEYHYGSQTYPDWNDASMYPVLQLQTNDEVSFRNISGSFYSGYFVGWNVA